MVLNLMVNIALGDEQESNKLYTEYINKVKAQKENGSWHD
jgi:hypothetical protein